MKDLPLSVLSRGCGQLISNRNTEGQDGRLEVCFTPQDYYIWKSQLSLLHLSNSGRLFAEVNSALPKTYSTRRGPLLLYSQGLVTMETSCGTEAGGREKRAVRQYTQQVEQQLSSLKEITAAIVSYNNNQDSSSRLAPPICYSHHLPLASNLHCPSPPLTQVRTSTELLVQRLPAEKNPELKNQPEDRVEEQNNRKGVRLDLFLQIPRTSRTPTPQIEPKTWVHYVAMTPGEPDVPQQTYTDISLQHTGSLQHTEITHHSTGGELHHPNMNSFHDTTDDRRCSTEYRRITCGEDDYERWISRNKHGRTGLVLPPVKVGHSGGHGPQEKTNRPTCKGPRHRAQRLPPIAGRSSVAPGQAVQAHTQQDAQPQTGRAGFQSPKNQNRLHHQPLFLPLLVPQKEEPPPPVAVLGCVAGRRGPRKKSSLAFLQKRLLEPCESSDDRGVVRGVLPLELRDFQNGRSVGSLILGPDGKIIQLSLYDSSQNPLQGDSDTQQQEREDLPWVLVLQPEHTNIGGGLEPNTDVPVADTEHHQAIHKRTGSHIPIRQFAGGELSFSTKQLSDLHRLMETDAGSASSHTDPVVMTKKKAMSAKAVTEIWKEPKNDAKNNVRMPPVREQVGKEELRDGNTDIEEEEEEEDLATTGQNGPAMDWGPVQGVPRLSPAAGWDWLQPPVTPFGAKRQRNVSPTEAETKNSLDKRRMNNKRQNAKEAAETPSQRDIQTVTSAESDEQKTSKMWNEGKWQQQKTGSEVQSTKNQKQEERTKREVAETQDHSALSPVKKRIKARGAERVHVKKNEEREEQGGEMEKQKESAGRRRRTGRLKHKEIVVGNPEDHMEKEEVETNEEIKEEFHLKSTIMSSASQKHNNRLETEEDTDILSTSDTHSGIRSMISLGSTSWFDQRSSWRSAASSCEGPMVTSAMDAASSRDRLSSCSTVMATEKQLMLNPVKPESSRPRRNKEGEEAAARRLAQQAERRRQEVERKKREQEEEERKWQEKKQTEERIKNELEEERRKKAEELRLKKLAEDEKRRRREVEEQERARQEQAQRERERRRQEEKRRQMERLHRIREEEEQRRKAELEHLQLEEEKRHEEEIKKLHEMTESERTEYLHRKEQKEEKRHEEEIKKLHKMDESERTEYLHRKEQEEEDRRREEEEEDRLQAELLDTEMALLQQHLAFKRGLLLQAGGLDKTQSISRPWIYSYFALLQILGQNPPKAETMTP